MEREQSPLLPVSKGGFWVKCENVSVAWTKRNFENLLRHIGIQGEYEIEMMRQKCVFVNFVANDDSIKFLKRTGYLEDEDVPKLEKSFLGGMRSRPCAECLYSYEMMVERYAADREMRLSARAEHTFRGRGHGRFRGRFQRGPDRARGHWGKRAEHFQQQQWFRGRGKREWRGHSFHSGHHESRSSVQYDETMLASQDGREESKGGKQNEKNVESGKRRFESTTHKRGKGERRQHDFESDQESARNTEQGEEKSDEKCSEPPRKRCRWDSKGLSPKDLRFRLSGRSGDSEKMDQSKDDDDDSREFSSRPNRSPSKGHRGRGGKFSIRRPQHQQHNRSPPQYRTIQLSNLPRLLTLAEISSIVRDAMGGVLVEDVSSSVPNNRDSLDATVVFKLKMDAERAEKDLNGYKYGERVLHAARVKEN